jgi:hypothetical protein
MFDMEDKAQTCRRCGKELKKSESIKRGYGPVCWEKIMIFAQSNEGKYIMYDDLKLESGEPVNVGFVFLRIGSRCATNVPHLATHHSPNGFEFGYGGSGPADLALNIIEYALRNTGHDGQKTSAIWGEQEIFKLSWDLHQRFKTEFIETIPQYAGGRIEFECVKNWIDAQVDTTGEIE